MHQRGQQVFHLQNVRAEILTDIDRSEAEQKRAKTVHERLDIIGQRQGLTDALTHVNVELKVAQADYDDAVGRLRRQEREQAL